MKNLSAQAVRLLTVDRSLRLVLGFGVVLLIGACAAKPPYDYTAFKQSRPKSMLVLPPINDSADVRATGGVMATVMAPLSEAGYYVMPVGMVDETFKQNGLTSANDIQDVSAAKLREIFGADAAVYIRVKEYGTKFLILGSDTRVTVEGRIVDLRSGALIWEGKATASSQESQGSSQGGLVGLLVQAVVSQIVNTATDASFNYASMANHRLLGAPRKNGVLYGPRSANYQKD
jgi:hypothetical protein